MVDTSIVHDERGNVSLSLGPSAVIWILSGSEVVQEIAYTPDNYPAWSVCNATNMSLKCLADHINENLQGWYVHKMNIEGVNVSEDGTVE